jgi:hypothetical protein
LSANWAFLQFVLGAFQANKVMSQTGENLSFFWWNFQADNTFQFSVGFFLHLQHCIQLIVTYCGKIIFKWPFNILAF